MTLPNFIIAGTARCGTTSLYYYLKQHPEVCFPETKEPKYFSSVSLQFPHEGPGDRSVDRKVVRSFDEYQSLFSRCAGSTMIGEASSDYLYYANKTAPAIRKSLGDIHIILIIRDPAERAFSAYANMLRDSRETLSFRESLEAEEGRLAANWDWMWAYKTGGLYYEQVKTFMDNFSRVKVLLYDDLRDDPFRLLENVFTFLNVDQAFKPDITIKYSQSGKPANPLVGRFLRRSTRASAMIRNTISRLLPRSVQEFLASKLLRKVESSPEDLAFLKNYFRPDIEKLERLLQADLSQWKNA
jgi:hypothetical protein